MVTGLFSQAAFYLVTENRQMNCFCTRSVFKNAHIQADTWDFLIWTLSSVCVRVHVRWWRSWSGVWPWRTAGTCLLCSNTTTAQRRPSRAARWWPMCSPSLKSKSRSVAARARARAGVTNSLCSSGSQPARTSTTPAGSSTLSSTASWTRTASPKTAWSSPSCSNRCARTHARTWPRSAAAQLIFSSVSLIKRRRKAENDFSTGSSGVCYCVWKLVNIYI